MYDLKNLSETKFVVAVADLPVSLLSGRWVHQTLLLHHFRIFYLI